VQLNPSLADRFSRLALGNISTAYPYKLDQILTGDADIRSPQSLHPAFCGSYDWHSCVHMHWTLARLLRLFPRHTSAGAARTHLLSRLTAANVHQELASIAGPQSASFERPYGWGWLLALAAELERLAQDDPEARALADAVRPLADEFAARFTSFLPRAQYPTRAGTHGNSAFALLLALDWCEVIQHRSLRRAITERANRWYGRDRNYPARFEPGGDDFLAAGLVEALVMQRVVDGCSFADWWHQFAPTDNELTHWMQPVEVSDPTDAKIVHLHGVNLTRAWSWQQLMPELDARTGAAASAAVERHLQASLPAATAGDYVGTHWLASFAVLALTV
jgi:hypothetical protein